MMQIPLQICVRELPKSEALEAHIREKVDRLEKVFAHIISCRVTVGIPHKHHQQGKQFNVCFDLSVPGKEIVVSRDHHEDPYVALRDAFNAAKRELEDFSHRIQCETKTHIQEHAGYVARIFHKEGFGFITGLDGTERYFHRENVINPRFEHLKAGDEVKFIDGIDADRPQAKRVSAGKHHLPQ